MIEGRTRSVGLRPFLWLFATDFATDFAINIVLDFVPESDVWGRFRVIAVC